MRRVAAGGHTMRVLEADGVGPALVFAADAPVVLEHYAPVLDLLRRDRLAFAIKLPGLVSRPPLVHAARSSGGFVSQDFGR